jgi:phosphate transport system protein
LEILRASFRILETRELGIILQAGLGEEHMSKVFEREIGRLKEIVLSFGAQVEEQVKLSVEALENQDGELARRVIKGDREIDEAEVVLEEECLKILALHSPVAGDLRFVVATLKINNDLERIADLAVSVAKRTVRLIELEFDKVPEEVEAIYKHVRLMLRKSLLSLLEQDVEIARGIIETDKLVNTLNRKIYQDFVSRAYETNIDREKQLLMLTIGKRFERISELTTNVAEDVLYLAEGEIVRHHRGRAEP